MSTLKKISFNRFNSAGGIPSEQDPLDSVYLACFNRFNSAGGIPRGTLKFDERHKNGSKNASKWEKSATLTSETLTFLL